ncbi:YARHG domain-containing protein [Flavobacterium sp.]|uniref:YARHG domain-containing protein n=1 Tax=Flavobacterium sp. TaxID=239 RepID=UPI003F697484
MKKILVLGVLVSIFSCKEAIKKEEKLVVENTFEEIQFVEPEITNTNVVNTVEDLLGYWVGDFVADISNEKRDTLYKEKKWSLLNIKITVSFDKIEKDSVFGHTIVAGNITTFKGIFIQNDKAINLNLDEHLNTKYNGFFEMYIFKKDSILDGNWSAYNPENVQIAKRKYNLHKKMFEYNPNNKVEYTFINEDKSNKIKYTDTIDGEVEEYEDYEFYSTTDKVFLKNASKELLEKDFVANLTKADIFILRNSIFARHGFAFRDKQLRIYFENFDWYMPVFGDVKDDLTEIEKQNIDLLLRYEQNAAEYYDTFGR